MIYREKKIYSGNMLEVEIFPITVQERKQSRSKKKKESLPKQKNLNDKNAKKHLIRLINTNFTDKDLSVTLSYKKDYLPLTKEEAKKDVDNFIRKLRRYIKKQQLGELKYIAVIEFKESTKTQKAVRMHHHLVINGIIDRDTVEKMWNKGRCNADRLKADEFGYEGLARYITKDPKGEKRWSQSRNLDQPTIYVNDYKYSNRKVREISRSQGEKKYFENLYKGYIYRDLNVTSNDITGELYIYIKMQDLGGKNET